jgi:hypothetical protein
VSAIVRHSSHVLMAFLHHKICIMQGSHCTFPSCIVLFIACTSDYVSDIRCHDALLQSFVFMSFSYVLDVLFMFHDISYWSLHCLPSKPIEISILMCMPTLLFSCFIPLD